MPAAPHTVFERERELAAVDGAALRAFEGDGSMVVIEGPAGIGKSRLMAEALSGEAASRLTVLSARASELEQEFSYGIVRQLFERALMDERVRDRALTGSAESAAEVVLPGPSGADPGSAFETLHGLYWLVSNMAEGYPVALTVDDLHWCDVPSLRFLAYLARRLEGVPALVLATLRSNEPGADPQLLGGLLSDPAVERIAVGPLGTDDRRAAGHRARPPLRRRLC